MGFPRILYYETAELEKKAAPDMALNKDPFFRVWLVRMLLLF